MEVLLGGEGLADQARAHVLAVDGDEAAVRLPVEERLGDAGDGERVGDGGDEEKRDRDREQRAEFGADLFPGAFHGRSLLRPGASSGR